MNYEFLEQDIYPSQIDGLFIIKINNNNIEDKDYLDLIGNEFIVNKQNYKIVTIMQDLPTGEYFALCKLLIIPNMIL